MLCCLPSAGAVQLVGIYTPEQQAQTAGDYLLLYLEILLQLIQELPAQQAERQLLATRVAAVKLQGPSRHQYL